MTSPEAVTIDNHKGVKRMTTPHITVDECRQRFIAAIDEVYYVAEQLAKHMGIATHYEDAKDCLDGLIMRVEDMPMDIENIRDDAMGDE